MVISEVISHLSDPVIPPCWGPALDTVLQMQLGVWKIWGNQLRSLAEYSETSEAQQEAMGGGKGGRSPGCTPADSEREGLKGQRAALPPSFLPPSLAVRLKL